MQIPIFKGCPRSIVERVPKRSNYYYGVDGFGDLEYDKPLDLTVIQKEHAVHKMYELVCKHPQNITFILLGPLTNFGLCSVMFADFNEKIKEIYVMGGNWRGRGNTTKAGEFNFYSDPEAAKAMFENTKRIINILPLETAFEGDFDNIPMEWRINELGNSQYPPVQLLNRVEEACVFNRGSKNWTECDVLLIACFLFPEAVIKKRSYFNATVELHGWETRGQMILDHKRLNEDNCLIIQDVNQNKYKEILLWTAGHISTDRLLEILKTK